MKKAFHCGWLCVTMTLSACAADMGDLDRTQAGKLKKSIFEGQWYHRQTVIGLRCSEA